MKKYFDEALQSEQAAQDKYYEEQDHLHRGEKPEWVEILRSPSCSSHPFPSYASSTMSSSDNISIHSAPPLFFHQRTSPRIMHKRTLSAAVSMSRPHSLYVPFHGCVDPPPGRAARDILHALSFAPTSSSECCYESSQGSLASSGSLSPHMLLPSIPQSPHSKPKNLRLKSKSSSLATLISISPNSNVSLETNSKIGPFILPLSYSTQELVQTGISSPLLPTTPTSDDRKTPTEPVYSPTNPLNNSENRALRVTHPPVIHPPPDLVQEKIMKNGRNRPSSECSSHRAL